MWKTSPSAAEALYELFCGTAQRLHHRFVAAVGIWRAEHGTAGHTGVGTGSHNFSDVVGFHVGTRFVLPNLFGKSSEMSDSDAGTYLLDKGNSSLNSNLSNSRSLGYFKFFGGLSLFLGKL